MHFALLRARARSASISRATVEWASCALRKTDTQNSPELARDDDGKAVKFVALVASFCEYMDLNSLNSASNGLALRLERDVRFVDESDLLQ